MRATTEWLKNLERELFQIYSMHYASEASHALEHIPFFPEQIFQLLPHLLVDVKLRHLDT